ncbi:MAG TPA: AI-2E family transporter [Candidatus Limnocylindrales bacterium]|nr:AI-2E family transporter [Candidatus Limnocylindrales bacterium]
MEERVINPVAEPRAGFGPISPRVALVVAAAIAIGIVLYVGRSALGPFIVGLVLAYLLDIPVERISRIGMPRWIAVLIVYVVAAVTLYQALRLMLRPLADEISTFIAELPRFTTQIADQYAHLDLAPGLRNAVDAFLAELGHGIGGIDPSALLPVASVFAGVLGTLVAYIIVPVWAFYLIKDRPALAAAAERSLPAAWRPDARAVAGLTLRVFGQWLRGQVILGLAVGIATFAGLILLSVTVDPIFGRFAIFLAVVAGVFELLPIIGPILSAIPAVLLALTAGVQPALAALVLYLVIQQVENNLFVPKIQGDAVELHPTIVMVALVLGGSIGGLLGAILALPIAAASRDVFRYVFHRVDRPPASPAEALAIIRAHPTIIERAVGDPTEPPIARSPAAPATSAPATSEASAISVTEDDILPTAPAEETRTDRS